MGEHLDRRDREHHRRTAAIQAAETAIAGGELPPPVPLGGERPGHAAEHGEVDLDHLRAAHQVLGDEFIKEHEIGAKAETEETVAAEA